MKTNGVRPVGLLLLTLLIVNVFFYLSCGQEPSFLESHYVKKEYRIPMRDGIKLFTAVYTPRDTSRQYPILLQRTPYGVDPYGENAYPTRRTGSWHHLAEEGFIFVFQDVRGRFMSEGEFVNMRPYQPYKSGSQEIDEASDTYDTIDWLLKNISHHNGRVGMWGISYPGFYAAMGAMDAHPALKAVSPQAPIADWFVGDDFHHNGAFGLNMAFRFFSVFGKPSEGLYKDWPPEFDFGTPDGYQFYLEMGPLPNANKKYLHDNIPFWNKIMKHGTYDEFWQSRNILQHFEGVKPAVMTVGGWFDAEDLYGPLHTYRTIEEKNPQTYNVLVMGPWYHGGWVRSEGDHLGAINFESKTGDFYKENIELPFFNFYLKQKGDLNLPEAYMFETGTNRWHRFNRWPPKHLTQKTLYLYSGRKLTYEQPAASNGKNSFDEYVSDPDKPVPYTTEISTKIPKPYMVEDQRFAARRPDVLVYQSLPLTEKTTIVGPITVDLYVSTSGSDADWIVKLIDVFPTDAPASPAAPETQMGGYQMLVRGDIMRGKFRNNYQEPEPFIPNQVTRVRFTLNDVFHAFLPGHKMMVQIQSSWFPLFDRNPQTFTDIYHAAEADFQKVVQRVFHSTEYPSALIVNVAE